MNLAVKYAKFNEFPCEGYPVQATIVAGTDVPDGYDAVISDNEYNLLKQKFDAEIIIRADSKDNEIWTQVMNRRNAELAGSDWAEINGSLPRLGYRKYIAFKVYRQFLRDVTIYTNPREVFWPQVPGNDDSALVLQVAPRMTDANRESWRSLLWNSAWEHRFDVLSDEGVTRVNELANYGFPKAVAVRDWVDSLWMAMYRPRSLALLQGEVIDFDFRTNNTIPYNIWEVVGEAMEMMQGQGR